MAITIGVTRGFGDHELRFRSNGIYLKPFLTPHPQVKFLFPLLPVAQTNF